MSALDIATLHSAFEAPFADLGQNAERDRASVVASWPSVPVEVIRAAGFAPVFARGGPAPTPAADVVLEAGVFPNRIHQLFEAALNGRLAHVAAIVLPRTSDPDYKAWLYLKELDRRGVPLPPVLLFDLLQTPGADTVLYNAARIRDLHAQLAQLGGRVPSVATLHMQIMRANAARGAARQLAAQRAGRPRLAGSEAMALLGASWQLPPERYRQLAVRAAEAIAVRAPRAGARLLLAGAPVDSSALHVAIEAQHGTVVEETSPFGSGAAGPDVGGGPDPCLALADWYMRNTVTARLSGVVQARRIEAALPGIDAAVLLLPPHDARHGWEYPRLRALFERHALPHLVLDIEPETPLDTPAHQRLRTLVNGARQAAVRHG